MSRLTLYSLFFLSFILTSCGNDEGFTVIAPPSGVLTVVNAIPDSQQLRFVARNRLIGNIEYGQATPASNVLPQIPLAYEALFLNRNDQIETLLTGQLILDVDFSQTVFLTGTMASAIAINVTNESFTFAADSSDSRIKFINISSNHHTVQLILSNPNDAANQSQTVTFENGVPSNFVTTTAGDGLQIEVRDDITHDVIWRSGDFTLPATANRLFALIDYFGPSGTGVRMISANEPVTGFNPFSNEELASTVRFLHVIENQSIVALREGSAAITNHDFGEISEDISFSAGERNFLVTVADDSTNELLNVTLTLVPGNFYTFVTAAATDANNYLFRIEDRRRRSTQALLSLGKLDNATGSVDIYLLDIGSVLGGDPLVSQVSQFAVTSLTRFPGTYDLYVTETGTTNVILGPLRVDLEAAGLYTLFITDAAGGGDTVQPIYLDDFNL